MPYCPFCRVAYPDGTTRCPDCQVPLADHLPPPEPEPITVATFLNQPEAEMWAELLRRAGIPCLVAAAVPGASTGGYYSAFVPHHIRVRAADVERARALLPPLDPG